MWWLQVKLQGIPGIRKVFMRELKTTHLDAEGMFQTENQWVLDTEGVNLLDVRHLPPHTPCLPSISTHFLPIAQLSSKQHEYRQVLTFVKRQATATSYGTAYAAFHAALACGLFSSS